MKKQINQHVRGHIKQIMSLLLWELDAIKLNLDKPFKLVSGNYSPIYINCRFLISNAPFMHLFASFAHWLIMSEGLKIDLVAGGETAGIPFAAYVAESQSLPMIYVRKKTKAHGIASLVEGKIEEGSRVLLVEDLITDAGSKIDFITGIRGAGGVIKETLVLFDRLQGGKESLEKEGVQLYSITDMESALRVANEVGFLTDDDLQSVREYLEDPAEWHHIRNLEYWEA